MRPLAIDLFCGLGGWTEGLLAEGYEVVGFDREAHQYGARRYPGSLVVQDVLTLHGSQFRDAALIVASPPCQAYSYRAMPWSRARALPPPDNTLFESCFRLQREASAAAGRHIPLVVENVRGAQKWVGRARWNYGSFYLWGDVPALMPIVVRTGVKVGGFSWSNFGKDDYIPQGFNRTAERHIKNIPHRTAGHWTNPAEHEGVKQGGSGAAWWDETFDARRREATAIKNGNDWFGPGEDASLQRFGSKSSGRKFASAMIAKIPPALARHIAAVYRPT
jgi:hypothetical protein